MLIHDLFSRDAFLKPRRRVPHPRQGGALRRRRVPMPPAQSQPDTQHQRLEQEAKGVHTAGVQVRNDADRTLFSQLPSYCLLRMLRILFNFLCLQSTIKYTSCHFSDVTVGTTARTAPTRWSASSNCPGERHSGRTQLEHAFTSFPPLFRVFNKVAFPGRVLE